MKKINSSEGLLIVVELGAEWPASEIEAARNAKLRRVLAQDETESPEAFARRVSEQLASSFPAGVAFAHAVVACSERIDAGAQGGRAELASSLAGALGRAGGGSLSFVACDRNDARSKPALSTLTADVTRTWQSAGVEVKLTFGPEPPELTDSAVDATTRANVRTSPRVKDAVRRVA